MLDCKNLKKEDMVSFNNDIFDHPCYNYICKLSEKEIIPYFRCNKNCKDYEPMKNND